MLTTCPSSSPANSRATTSLRSIDPMNHGPEDRLEAIYIRQTSYVVYIKYIAFSAIGQQSIQLSFRTAITASDDSMWSILMISTAFSATSWIGSRDLRLLIDCTVYRYQSLFCVVPLHFHALNAIRTSEGSPPHSLQRSTRLSTTPLYIFRPPS